MSATTRNRRVRQEGSKAELVTDEVEMHGFYNPITQNGPWVAKDGANENDHPGSDDVDYGHHSTAAGGLPAAMEAEPYNLQTHYPQDFRADKKEEEVACFSKFKRSLRGCWKTRLTENTKDDRELYVITSLRELIIYIFFVVLLCIMTFGMFHPNMYYYTKIMKALFIESTDFESYTTMKDFFTYAKGDLLKGLYWETHYNGQPVKESQEGYVYFENKVIGRPRFRQVRVRNDSCTVADDFQNDIKECYAPYSTTVEDKRPFGFKNGTVWNYQTSDQLGGPSIHGQVARYDAGGYTFLAGRKKITTLRRLEFLERNLWLDRATRAVFIDFTVYNANINLFCIITLMFEYPATGGCIPYSQFRTAKLIRYVTTMDYVVLACEFIFAAFIIYYTIEELIEVSLHGKEYIKDPWNIYDILILLMGYVTLFFVIYVYINVKDMLHELLHKNNEFADFATVAYYQDIFNQFLAVFVFLAWVKIFKYVSFNKTMTQLQNTLSSCAKDVGGFAIMFFIVFFAYAQWGYLLFGTQVKDYSTYGSCIFTLFRIILGDFDFPAMEAANRIMGPIYFITYVFFVFFVLINMFLAIINDTYAEVKNDLSQQDDEFELGDYFKRGYDRLVEKLSFKKERIVDIQKALQTADTNQDNKVDYEEWRMELKSRGHADAEIEAVFAKYDLDGDRVLNEKEVQGMHEDLEGQKVIDDIPRKRSIDEDEIDGDEDSDGSSPGHRPQTVPFEEFTVLSRRVDRLEHSIGSIVSKIDAVLTKLEAMDQAKMKRRETMNRLLDTLSEPGVNQSGNARQDMEQIVRDELVKWDTDSDKKDDDNDRPTSSGSGSGSEKLKRQSSIDQED